MVKFKVFITSGTKIIIIINIIIVIKMILKTILELAHRLLNW